MARSSSVKFAPTMSLHDADNHNKPTPMPLIVTLNCIEDCGLEQDSLAGVAAIEHVGLNRLADGRIESASAVLLHSLAFLPRAAQRRLRPWQLILCLGSVDRSVDSALAADLGLRLVHVDVSRSEEVADTVMALVLGLLRRTHLLSRQSLSSSGWLGSVQPLCRGMRRCRGLVLGIVGRSASARSLATRSLSFKMNVLYFDVQQAMAARSPNLRFQKALSNRQNENKKCPLSAPPKPSKPRIPSSDEKENAPCCDINSLLNRDFNVNHGQSEGDTGVKHETSKKTKAVQTINKSSLKENRSGGVGIQGVKYKKQKTINPKPFRLRTDERSILKEATLERKQHEDENQINVNSTSKVQSEGRLHNGIKSKKNQEALMGTKTPNRSTSTKDKLASCKSQQKDANNNVLSGSRFVGR